MELNKDQIRIIKSTVTYVCTALVIYPLARYLFGKPISWSDFFVFAGIMIAVGLIVGGFFTWGSKIPKKEDN